MKRLSLLIALFAVTSAFAQQRSNYNFQYKAEGTKAILPVQVFDDGQQTIFQFKQNQSIPAIFIENSGQWQLIEPETKGNYFYLPSIATRFKLKLGLSEAAVQFVGGGRDNQTVDLPVNHITKRSYAAVAKGDDYEWIANKDHLEQAVVFKNKEAKVTVNSAKNFASLAPKLLKATSIEVVAYNQSDFESGLAQQRLDAIVNSLTAFGIERTKIKKSISLTGASEVTQGVIGARISYVLGSHVKPVNRSQDSVTRNVAVEAVAPKKTLTTEAVAPKNSKQLFRIESGDKSILEVIQRWAQKAQWDVIAIDFPHIPLEQVEPTQIAYGSYLDAITKMEQGLVAKGYTSIRSRAYTNNVLEIGALNEPD